MRRLLLILTLLYPATVAFAQNVTDAFFSQEGKQVLIHYHLDAPADIYVFLSEDGGKTFGNALKCVSGDVGANVPAGDKTAVWDVLAERDILQSNNVVLKICAAIGVKPFTVNGVPFEMIHVQGDTFLMGCDSELNNCDDDEKPPHSITLNSFYMGKYEVTQALWRAVMGTAPPLCSPSHFKGDDLPVENVSRNDCKEFIRKLNSITGEIFRLPTEAEWEYAAKGGILQTQPPYIFSGSNTINEVAWYVDNSNGKTHKVGSKSPNELGLFDMSGNVYEWCYDWSDNYTGDSLINPTGPPSGLYRVLRGGSWNYPENNCRVSYRGYYHPYPPRQPHLDFYSNYSGLKFAGSRLTYCEGLASVMCPSTNDSHVSGLML